MQIKLGRDPFARETITRVSIAAIGKGRDWCGGTNGRGELFQYFIEKDSGKTEKIKGQFCSLACCNSYHGY